jgi:hypothetical protein
MEISFSIFAPRVALVLTLILIVFSLQVSADQTKPLETHVTGVTGRPVALKIEAPGEKIEDTRFVLVRGMPAKVRLSTGFRTKKSWFIAISEINDVRLVPNNYTGKFTLELFFVKEDKNQTASSRIRIRVQILPDGSPKPETKQTLALSTSDAPTFSAQPDEHRTPATLTPAQETEMLRKGDEFLERGDVASARLLFKGLAEQGSSWGAFAMARSYDPGFLKKIWIIGALKPDIEKAKLWYQRASDLGNSKALSYLNKLKQ